MRKQKILALSLVIILNLFAFYLTLAWTEPSSAPPGNNVPELINVSSTPQTKSGDLTVANLYLNAGSSGEGSIINADYIQGYNDLHLVSNDSSGSHETSIYLGTSTSGAKKIAFYIDDTEKMTLDSNGNLIVKGDIYLPDSSTRLLEGGNNSVRVQTNSGYLEIGPQNTSWSHFTTDRARFYFNKTVTVAGHVRPYTDNSTDLGEGSSYAWRNLYIDGGIAIDGSFGSSGQVLKTDGSQIYWGTDETGGGGGDITAVNAGTGLSGGGTSGDVTLSLNTGGISGCTNSTTDKIIWDSSSNRLTCATDQTGGATGCTDVIRSFYADSGSKVASGCSDTLTIAGGSGISTSISGSTLTITNAGVINEADTLQTVTDRGKATTNSITTAGLNLSGNGSEGDVTSTNLIQGYNDLSLQGDLNNQAAIYLTGSGDSQNASRRISFYINNGTEVLRLDNSGNLGIGTTSPSYKLDVSGDINISGVYRKGGTAGVSSSCPAGQTFSGITTSGGIVTSTGSCVDIGGSTFWTDQGTYIYPNNYTDFVIGDSGKVGIGTTSLTYKLEIYSDDSWDGIRVKGTDASTGVNGLIIEASNRKYHIGVGGGNHSSFPNTFFIYDSNAGANRFVINSSGNIGIGTNSPSAKLDVNGGVRIRSLNCTSNANGGKITTDASGNLVCADDTGGGGIGGSISAGQVAFGTGTDTIGGDNDLYWDNTNKRLGIGTTSPSYKLDVGGKANATELCIAGDCRTNWPAGGGIDGSGSANKIAIWSDSDTLTYDDELSWNSFAHTLTINSTTSSSLELSTATNEYVVFSESDNNLDIYSYYAAGILFLGFDSVRLDDDLYVGNALANDNDYIYFDAGAEYLEWDNTNAKFSLSDDLFIQNNLWIGDDLQVGANSSTDDDFITFDDAGEYLKWSESGDKFIFSNDLQVNGKLDITTKGRTSLGCASTGWKYTWISFPVTFSSTPTVIITGEVDQASSTNRSPGTMHIGKQCSQGSVTTSGFCVTYNCSESTIPSAYIVNWIAIGN